MIEAGGVAAETERAPRGRFRRPAGTAPAIRQRRATDWNRLVLAGLVVTAAALRARHPTTFEQQLFSLVNTLPGGLRPLFSRLYSLASAWAFGLIIASGVLTRRWRLARDLLLAAALALVTARVLGLTIQDGIGQGLRVFVRAGTGPSFPLVRLSVATAVVAAGAPYFSRPVRWAGRAAIVLIAPAATYLGLAYPNDVLAALALGWGAAAAVHLMFGSPAGRPTLGQITASLRELGVRVPQARLEHHQPQGATLLSAESADGPLRIKVLGRDEAEAQLFSKLWRSLLYKESGRTLQLTRLQEVEHEAYTVLAARNAGVRAPDVVAAGMAGPGAAFLVLREPEGVRLAGIETGLITDDLLAAIWRQAELLHSAHLIHGRLNAHALIVTPDGPAVTGFDVARSAIPEASTAGDVAELLASLASLVGPERAVRSALASAEGASMVSALPLLQIAALTPQTRSGVGSRKDCKELLSRLREAGAAATGTAPPALQQLHRVSGANLLLAVGTLLAIGGLLAAVGSPAQLAAATRHARWNWLAAAFAISMSTTIAYTLALLGTVTQRLPLWPTIELQVGLALSNVAVPLGGTAMQVRYLQHHGSDLPSAIAAGGLLSTVGSAVAQGGLLVVALALSPHTIHIGNLPTESLPVVALATVLVAGVIVALVMGLPMLRRMVVPPVRHAVAAIWGAVRSPRRLTLLLGGNLAAAILYGACLSACLEAFGAHVSFWTVLALDVGISGIAALIPIPGGGTALSAVGLSGALVAVGVAQEAAVGAVLANQLIVTYLPAIPGWFATEDLIRRDYL